MYSTCSGCPHVREMYLPHVYMGHHPGLHLSHLSLFRNSDATALTDLLLCPSLTVLPYEDPPRCVGSHDPTHTGHAMAAIPNCEVYSITTGRNVLALSLLRRLREGLRRKERCLC